MLLLSNGMHLMVKEPPDEVVSRAIAYRHRVAAGPEPRGRLVPLRPSASED
ncbi:MAG: flagellar FlbD family protein [Anaeromyxobacter sp.]